MGGRGRRRIGVSRVGQGTVGYRWDYCTAIGIAHAGSDGTRRRTGGEVKGKDANGVGSQSSCIHTPHSSTASS